MYILYIFYLWQIFSEGGENVNIAISLPNKKRERESIKISIEQEKEIMRSNISIFSIYDFA